MTFEDARAMSTGEVGRSPEQRRGDPLPASPDAHHEAGDRPHAVVLEIRACDSGEIATAPQPGVPRTRPERQPPDGLTRDVGEQARGR